MYDSGGHYNYYYCCCCCCCSCISKNVALMMCVSYFLRQPPEWMLQPRGHVACSPSNHVVQMMWRRRFKVGSNVSVNIPTVFTEAFEKLRKVTFLHVFVCVKWVFSTRMEGEVIGAGPYRATKLVRDVLVTFRRQLITYIVHCYVSVICIQFMCPKCTVANYITLLSYLHTLFFIHVTSRSRER